MRTALPQRTGSRTIFQRLDKGDATESGTAGSRVKNLAEKIAGMRERRGQSLI
jgi:hypothetical protein